MIKLEHVVLASPEQMRFIIEGMRNPMNSWGKSDSRTCRQDGAFCMECEHKNNYCLGENDHSLMQRLSNAGTDHRKFMRMLLSKPFSALRRNFVALRFWRRKSLQSVLIKLLPH